MWTAARAPRFGKLTRLFGKSEKFPEVIDLDFIRSTLPGVNEEEIMPVYQVLKQGKKQLTRTDIELIVASKMNQKCKENAVAIAKALSTPGDVESIKGLLADDVVYLTDSHTGNGYRTIRGIENVINAMKNDTALFESLRRVSTNETITAIPHLDTHRMHVTARWSLVATVSDAETFRAENEHMFITDYGGNVLHIMTRTDYANREIQFDPKGHNRHRATLRMDDLPSVCDLNVNGEEFIVKAFPAGDVAVRRKVKSRLIFVADNTEHLLDLRRTVKCAVACFEYASATAADLAAQLRTLVEDFTLNEGFHEVCLIAEKPREEGESGIAWNPTFNFNMTSSAQMRDPTSDAMVLLQALKDSLVVNGKIHLLGCSAIMNMIPSEFLFGSKNEPSSITWESPSGVPKEYLKVALADSRTVSTYEKRGVFKGKRAGYGSVKKLSAALVREIDA